MLTNSRRTRPRAPRRTARLCSMVRSCTTATTASRGRTALWRSSLLGLIRPSMHRARSRTRSSRACISMAARCGQLQREVVCVWRVVACCLSPQLRVSSVPASSAWCTSPRSSGTLPSSGARCRVPAARQRPASPSRACGQTCSGLLAATALQSSSRLQKPLRTRGPRRRAPLTWLFTTRLTTRCFRGPHTARPFA